MPDFPSLGYIALGGVAVLLIVLLVVVLLRRRRPAPIAVPAAPEPVPFLERLGDGEGLRKYALTKPVVVIGRTEDSDVRVSVDWPGGRSVSRRHAQIRREDTDFVVEDLGSQNGIRVNGLATHRNLLREGYRVSFGDLEFVFHGFESSHEDGGDS